LFARCQLPADWSSVRAIDWPDAPGHRVVTYHYTLHIIISSYIFGGGDFQFAQICLATLAPTRTLSLSYETLICALFSFFCALPTFPFHATSIDVCSLLVQTHTIYTWHSESESFWQFCSQILHQ